MKLRYLLALICTLGVLAACHEEDRLGSLSGLHLDNTFVSLPAKGGDTTVVIQSATEWKVEPEYAGWLSLSRLQGNAGDTRLTLHADSTDIGRETDVRITNGNVTQYLRVRQGSLDATVATCADVIAGIVGKVYRVTVTVTAITNTKWGNMNVSDETGSIVIYGTLDAKGTEGNFMSLGIDVGDQLTLEGPMDKWEKDYELVNVTVLSIRKSLLTIYTPAPTLTADAGTLQVKVAYKGKGLMVDVPADCDWLRYRTMSFTPGVPTKLEAAPADTALVTLAYDANLTGEAREAKLKFTSANATSSTTTSFLITQQ